MLTLYRRLILYFSSITCVCVKSEVHVYVILRPKGPYWEKLCRPRALLATEGTVFPITGPPRPVNNFLEFFFVFCFFVLLVFFFFVLFCFLCSFFPQVKKVQVLQQITQEIRPGPRARSRTSARRRNQSDRLHNLQNSANCEKKIK